LFYMRGDSQANKQRDRHRNIAIFRSPTRERSNNSQSFHAFMTTLTRSAIFHTDILLSQKKPFLVNFQSLDTTPVRRTAAFFTTWKSAAVKKRGWTFRVAEKNFRMIIALDRNRSCNEEKDKYWTKSCSCHTRHSCYSVRSKLFYRWGKSRF